jgi:hypothetical protein
MEVASANLQAIEEANARKRQQDQRELEAAQAALQTQARCLLRGIQFNIPLLVMMLISGNAADRTVFTLQHGMTCSACS